MLLLLHPPFDPSAQEPGYIKGYPPGMRENGGQYTHAAAWIVMALARLGSGDEAAEMFHMLNPVNHARTRPTSRDTRSSPTSSPATSTAIRRIAGGAGGAGTRGRRAGCTAPASRAFSACGARAPPSPWTRAFRGVAGYQIVWRFRDTTYKISVSNPERRCRGVRRGDARREERRPSHHPPVERRRRAPGRHRAGGGWQAVVNRVRARREPRPPCSYLARRAVDWRVG